ncbi:hypothetical protein Patl1_29532 [Pistacia atlantica]|uniref:Uncharacterized protein n=1 Tax=Pistacia atlantica TaxID=434234 RepID=A0ACC1AAI1_9ROSI|nr:hypothetical protein Patl1_29532 [Pistacia atlantica]
MKLISISKPTPYSGWFFIVIGSVSFLGFLFAAIISKLLPPFDNPILSAIQNDRWWDFGGMFCVFHGVGRVCLAFSEGRLVRFRWENLNWYYCFLVPLTLPMIVVAVYFHWLSMKLFKHA